MGTGEAVVTILSEKGVPTPVVHTRLRAPRSSMTESSSVAERGEGVAALGEVRHPPGAGECGRAAGEARRSGAGGARDTCGACDREKRRHAKPAGNALTDFLGSRQGKTLQREVVRGAFSLLRKRL